MKDESALAKSQLRQMNLLDCSPGCAGPPSAREPVGIITFEYADEIEQPIMLHIRDVQLMAKRALQVLAHHGDDQAAKIAKEYFSGAAPHTERSHSWLPGLDPGPVEPQAPQTIAIPAFGLDLLARQNCPFCHGPFDPTLVQAAGIRRQEGRTFFFYEIECPKCHKPSMTVMTSRPCNWWGLLDYIAEMLAAAPTVNTQRKASKPRGYRAPVTIPAVAILKMRDRAEAPYSEFSVLGGYKTADKIVLLTRMIGPENGGHDSLMRIGPNDTIHPTSRVDECLPPAEWPKFCALAPARQFRLRGRSWRKMSVTHLRRLLGKKIYMLADEEHPQ